MLNQSIIDNADQARRMETVKLQIRKLIERCQQVQSDGSSAEFSEADVGSKFILPLLEALGLTESDILF
jgi:hypothetical protein